MSKQNMTNPMTVPPAALTDYQDWLKTIKQRIHATGMKVALAANGELISLYYKIGAPSFASTAIRQFGNRLLPNCAMHFPMLEIAARCVRITLGKPE